MQSKQPVEKCPKLDAKSKKLFKSRKTPSKKFCSSKSPAQSKKAQPKSCLAFYLSEQCSQILSPFTNSQLYPKTLQTGFQDPNSMFAAFSSFKGQETVEPFEDNIEKMRFLGSSQEGLIERFLQDKYSCSKNSASLQEIYCYSTAKNLLQSQFQEFFQKRSEFMRQLQPAEHVNFEPAAAEKSDGAAENSFSTTNVSSPSISSTLMLSAGYCPESYYLFNAKTAPEMMLSLLGEGENAAAHNLK